MSVSVLPDQLLGRQVPSASTDARGRSDGVRRLQAALCHLYLYRPD